MKNTKRRTRPQPATPEEILQELAALPKSDPTQPLTTEEGTLPSQAEFFEAARAAGVAYRRACGLASRANLDPSVAHHVRGRLFKLRHDLDARIEATLLAQFAEGSLPPSRLLKRQVFGFCKKQGVSFRLSLSTCVPTALCGGGCYAHDGRERVTSTIISGCYNTVLCGLFESGRISPEDIRPLVEKAVSLARLDQQLAARDFGFQRRARIRLAHVGEIAAFPKFANWLGSTVASLSDGSVDCIVYTRHPNVTQLDTSALIVNLTLDEASESRRKWAISGTRVVWSAWGGRLDPQADVNFLEHHDNGQHSVPAGAGHVCPVTVASVERRVCDEFACVRCFEPPGESAAAPLVVHDIEVNRVVRRPRHRSMLGE